MVWWEEENCSIKVEAAMPVEVAEAAIIETRLLDF